MAMLIECVAFWRLALNSYHIFYFFTEKCVRFPTHFSYLSTILQTILTYQRCIIIIFHKVSQF